MPGQLLSINILGDSDQGILTEFRFYPGEVRTFKCQIYDTINSQKWIIPASSTLTLTLPGTPTDLTVLNADITIDSIDGSIFSTTLSAVQTAALISGGIILKIDTAVVIPVPGTITRYAERDHAIKKVTLS